MAQFDFQELYRKAVEWREWYYGREPQLNPVAEPVREVFQLINSVLFGHIYQRPAVETKIRSLCTIAALTVLDRHRQIGDHIKGALRSGATKQEVLEIITQMLFYGGYPVVVNALRACQQAFEEYDREVAEKGGQG